MPKQESSYLSRVASSLTSAQRRLVADAYKHTKDFRRLLRSNKIDARHDIRNFRVAVITYETGVKLAETTVDVINNPPNAGNLVAQLSGLQGLHSLSITANSTELENMSAMARRMVVPRTLTEYLDLTVPALASEIIKAQANKVLQGETPGEVQRRTRIALDALAGTASLDDVTLQHLLAKRIIGTDIDLETLKQILDSTASFLEREIGNEPLHISMSLVRELARGTQKILRQTVGNITTAEQARVTTQTLDPDSSAKRAQAVRMMLDTRIDNYLADHRNENESAPRIAHLATEIFFAKRIHHARADNTVKQLANDLVTLGHEQTAAELLFQAQNCRLVIVHTDVMQYYIDAGFSPDTAQDLVNQHRQTINRSLGRWHPRNAFGVINTSRPDEVTLLQGTLNFNHLAHRSLMAAAMLNQTPLGQARSENRECYLVSINRYSEQRYLEAVRGGMIYLPFEARLDLAASNFRGLDATITSIDDPSKHSSTPKAHFEHFKRAVERQVGKLHWKRVCGLDRFLDSSPQVDAIEVAIRHGEELKKIVEDPPWLDHLASNYPDVPITLLILGGAGNVSSSFIHNATNLFLKTRDVSHYNLATSALHPDNWKRTINILGGGMY